MAHTGKSFVLPELIPGMSVSRVMLRCSPNPTAQSCPFPSYVRQGRPFASDPDEAILLMILEYGEGSYPSGPDDEPHTIYSVVTHRCALLSHVLSAWKGPNGYISTTVLPWKLWGEDATRWFEEERTLSNRHKSVNGERWVRMKEDINGSRDAVRDTKRFALYLEIYDFRKIRFQKKWTDLGRRGAVLYRDTYYGRKKVVFVDRDSPTILHPGDVFKEEVRSTLPYMHTSWIPRILDLIPARIRPGIGVEWSWMKKE